MHKNAMARERGREEMAELSLKIMATNLNLFYMLFTNYYRLHCVQFMINYYSMQTNECVAGV